MIHINHVSFRYASSKKYILKDIDLHIQKGETVVLLGSSGCGKTTITRLINRLIPEFCDGEMLGSVVIDGHDGATFNIQDLSTIVGSVFQDPRSQFFATDTTSEIAFGCENAAIPQEELRKRIETTVQTLQIENLLERNIFKLSSGEKQLIAIASVCALAPKILVLDEPSANLDSAATIQLMKILQRLKSKGYTLVISEHRIHYLRKIADRALVLQDGKIIKELKQPAFRNLTNEEANALGLRSMDLDQIKPKRSQSDQSESQLHMQRIAYHYNKKIHPLKEIHLQATKGMIVGIIGHNGAGKSTLLSLICGLKKEKHGQVRLKQKPCKPKERMKHTYLVMQDSDYQLFTESVEKELYLGCKPEDANYEKGLQLLDRLGLSGLSNNHPHALSGGQKQRLCIAVAGMKGAEIICLDEPTSGLDYRNMKKVSELLKELAQEEKTLILTSHDYEFLITTCTHICHIRNGRVEDFFSVDARESTLSKIRNIMDQGLPSNDKIAAVKEKLAMQC